MSYEIENLKRELRQQNYQMSMLESELQRCKQSADDANSKAQDAQRRISNMETRFAELTRALSDAINQNIY